LKISAPILAAGKPVTISTTVTNAGERDGDEVVQFYVSQAAPGAPITALKGFQRIHLRRGESRTVSFVLDDDAASIVDPNGQRRITPGAASVWIGGGQPVSTTGGQHLPGTGVGRGRAILISDTEGGQRR
jgi:beta-glucosidase